LIDGCRGLTELVRLTGRRQEEVSALLRELESAGLIRQK
jgi:predicted transcriptional regulator